MSTIDALSAFRDALKDVPTEWLTGNGPLAVLIQAESALEDINERIAVLVAERNEARAELAAIRAALGNGADEAAWPSGLTLAEVVGRLRGEHHSLRDVLQWVNDQCPGKCSAVCDSALRASHEGPHAEALGDNGGTRG